MLSARLSLSSVSSAAPVCSPCFRTDAAGHIALARDWPALFQRASQLGEIALQSRHTYARLIHLGPPPALTWNAAGTIAHDEAGALRFDCAKWGAARGRLAVCDCCGSPGRIEVQNAHGAEFLQLCPLPATPPAHWAACLADLLPRGPFVPVAPTRILTGFTLAPENARPLAATAAPLVDFLSRLVDTQVALRCTLATPEFAHRREFVPHGLEVDSSLLSLGDLRITVQLALPGVRGLALDAAGDALHVVGPGGTLLLTVARLAAPELWAAALHATFPALRPFP